MISEIAEHRSIRSYTDKPIDKKVMDEMLAAATRASNTGNMQLYSIIVTTSEKIKEQLAPLHFNQKMVTNAPAVVTFCADINRFSKWCRMRGAKPEYDNFAWFMNAATDALLASQNMALEAESHGLGICYLGTTIYNAAEISQVLELPKGVAPVATLTIGYPAQDAPLNDRFPVDAVVHYDRYSDYDDNRLEHLWRERESSEETADFIRVNELPNLARIFTERRYKGDDNIVFSRKYLEFLRQQGFFNQ